jgi:hypothetical protein
VRIFKDLFGRRTPPKANLDNLFAVPSAAIGLEAATGFRPTGVASVCYRAAEGGAFAETADDVQQLLDADGGPKVERSTDEFGFTWLVCRHDPTELSELITEIHAVNSSLENAGFGPSLLCSVIVFEGRDGNRVGLVYLYKQGTFYPFAPEGQKRRDNSVELQLRGVLADELPVEEELGRWMALWDAPGL